MIQEGCAPDQKAYITLARGLLQAGAADKAAEVIRCAHGLPGHSLRKPAGTAVGVDSRCLTEVLAGLGEDAAQKLAADLLASGRCIPGAETSKKPKARQGQPRRSSLLTSWRVAVAFRVPRRARS